MNRSKLEQEFRHHADDLRLTTQVISDGPINADIAIVGEGPGETEIRQSLPFVGGSGKLLWDCLRPYGLHRANVYTTNVVKRQISLSRKGDERHVVHRDELNKWIGLVRWELARLPNLRIVFALGNFALEALTSGQVDMPGAARSRPHTGILNWRGSVIDWEIPGPDGKPRRIKLVLSINPAYALRELKMEPMFKMDCYKLDMVNRSVFKQHEVECLINPNFLEARNFIRKMIADKKPVSFDIEVINHETACWGLSNDPHLAMCINLRDHAGNRYMLDEEFRLHEEMQNLFDACNKSLSQTQRTNKPRLELVAQNGMFDSYWSWLHDHLRPIVHFDTLLAHHTLYPQLPHSLAFLVAQYTTHPYYKDEGKFWKEGGDINQFWRYNASDAALTLAVSERERRELEQQGLAPFFYDHVMRLQPHSVAATVHGVAVDHIRKEEVEEKGEEDVASLKADFYHFVHELTKDKNYFPNPDSPAQMQELYFDRLHLKGRGRSTDEANRERIVKDPATPLLAKEMITAYNRFKEERVFHSTFAKARTSDDGRMRGEYRQYGVSRAPGRLSSRKLLDGTGINFQNQPERAREMYIADPGCCFIYFDLKGAEAVVVAYRANIESWKEEFARAKVDPEFDVHRSLASRMFKIPYDEIPKKDFLPDSSGILRPTKRYVGKRSRHGLNYRMQPDMLSQVTGLPYYEARQAFAKYHGVTPELRPWWSQEERTFKATRELWNGLGRRFKVIQRIDDTVLESIVAFYPQSTIGDKVQQVWYRSMEDDEWPDDARIAINVHDSLTGISVQLPKKTALTALRIMKKHAETPIMIQDAWNNPAVPVTIQAECKISVPDEEGIHRWSNLKEVQL